MSFYSKYARFFLKTFIPLELLKTGMLSTKTCMISSQDIIISIQDMYAFYFTTTCMISSQGMMLSIQGMMLSIQCMMISFQGMMLWCGWSPSKACMFSPIGRNTNGGKSCPNTVAVPLQLSHRNRRDRPQCGIRAICGSVSQHPTNHVWSCFWDTSFSCWS